MGSRYLALCLIFFNFPPVYSAYFGDSDSDGETVFPFLEEEDPIGDFLRGVGPISGFFVRLRTPERELIQLADLSAELVGVDDHPNRIPLFRAMTSLPLRQRQFFLEKLSNLYGIFSSYTGLNQQLMIHAIRDACRKHDYHTIDHMIRNTLRIIEAHSTETDFHRVFTILDTYQERTIHGIGYIFLEVYDNISTEEFERIPVLDALEAFIGVMNSYDFSETVFSFRTWTYHFSVKEKQDIARRVVERCRET